MDELRLFLDQVKNWVWSPPLFILLFGVGIYLSVLLRGLQFRYLPYALRLVITPGLDQGSKGDITHFQALMTSLAGAVGTGSIAGVATAMTVGGQGALFWMWVTALVGMATKYAEALLAVKYRVTDELGEMEGGPMLYIEKGLGSRWLAILFAIFGCAAAVGTGGMVQANSISDALVIYLPVSPWIIGLVTSVVTGMVVFGGVKVIGRVASVLVPAMGLFYVGAGLIVIGANLSLLPEAMCRIVLSAFTGQAAVGGFLGTTVAAAVQMGVARGVFSNESGLGISSIAAAAAKTDQPARQALVAMTGTFLSTMLICTITGLAIAVTGTFGITDASGRLLTGIPLVVRAFESVIPYGGAIVSGGLLLFAYTTIVAWSYYGEKCCEYLLGARWERGYRVLYTLLLIPGAAVDLEVVWGIADVANGLMVIPNVIAIFFLGKVVKQETERFLKMEGLEGNAREF